MKEYRKITRIDKTDSYSPMDMYYTAEYTEYREDGSIKCKGTEDFSGERKNTLHSWDICVPTNKTNKGGHTIWDKVDNITTTDAKNAKKIATFKYGNKVQLRKIR